MPLSNLRLDSLTSCKNPVFVFLLLHYINAVPEIELNLASDVLFTAIPIQSELLLLYMIAQGYPLQEKFILSGEYFL